MNSMWSSAADPAGWRHDFRRGAASARSGIAIQYRAAGRSVVRNSGRIRSEPPRLYSRGGESFEADGYPFHGDGDGPPPRFAREDQAAPRRSGQSLGVAAPASENPVQRLRLRNAPTPRSKPDASRVQTASELASQHDPLHFRSRVLLALPALWLIVTMVFLLAHIVPGDPVQQMLGEGARAEDVQQLRHSLGLDLPISVQYGRYLAGFFRGDLGESFRFQQPVDARHACRITPRRWNWRSSRCWFAWRSAFPREFSPPSAAAPPPTTPSAFSRCWDFPCRISRSARC